MLTIITYHYVRDLPNTPYPRVNGLLTQHFIGQLDYVAKHYTIVGSSEIIKAMRGETILPPMACALTFDDGFIDHYVTVLPLLKKRGMVGSFFPIAKVVEEDIVLDVHKIHFIKAVVMDHQAIIKEIFSFIQPYRTAHEIPADEELFRQYAVQGRYDPPEVMFIKRVLQRGLPEPVRVALVDELFRCHVSSDEQAFARNLYMNMDQLKEMMASGMEIGGHGYTHTALDVLSEAGQEDELRRTVSFLGRISPDLTKDWAMAYPHGNYNEATLKILCELGCAIGLTINIGLVEDFKDPLELSRLNTNDFPCHKDAEPAVWTQKVYDIKKS